MSVTLTLEDYIDVSRGNMIVKVNNQPQESQDIDVMMCWLNNKTPHPRSKYYLRHTSNEVMAMIKEVVYKVDVNTLQRDEENKDLKMNDIARVRLRTTKPLFIDEYRDNRITGSIILVDETTNETVAAGMIN